MIDNIKRLFCKYCIEEFGREFKVFQISGWKRKKTYFGSFDTEEKAVSYILGCYNDEKAASYILSCYNAKPNNVKYFSEKELNNLDSMKEII